jgi:hypothetical protein
VRRVAHEQRPAGPRAPERDLDQIGRRLGRLDVLARSCSITQMLCAEQFEVPLEVLAGRGAREDDLPALLLGPLDQRRCTGQGAHLGQQRLVLPLPAVAQRVAVLALGGLAEQGLDELIAAHADQPMDTEGGHGEPAGRQRALPGERVEVRAVDERPVDVEQEPRRRGRLQYHLPFAKPPNAIRPISAIRMPSQCDPTKKTMIPTITRIPPRPIPAPLPDCDAMTHLRLVESPRTPSRGGATLGFGDWRTGIPNA